MLDTETREGNHRERSRSMAACNQPERFPMSQSSPPDRRYLRMVLGGIVALVALILVIGTAQYWATLN